MNLPTELSEVSLPIWANYLAQDADGSWWAYEADPNQHHQGWYENEVGRSQFLCKHSPTSAWQSCLIKLAR